MKPFSRLLFSVGSLTSYCRKMCHAGKPDVRLLLLALSFSSMSTPGLQAQSPDVLAKTALALAPQDAAFFATSLDMKRSWEQFLQGSFVSKLRRVPYVQSLEQEISNQWRNPQGPVLQAKSTLENPNVRNLLRLTADMFSDEFFVYGSNDWCEMIEELIAFQSRMMAAIQQNPESIATFFQELQREDVDAIRIPTTVIGFRLANDDNARMQLDQLEGILRIGGGQQEEFKPFLEKLKRKDFKDGQSLTITLDASMIPLDEVGEEQLEDVRRLIGLLEGRQLSLTLGVKEKMLLVALGEEADLLAGIGASDASLLDHPAMEVLKQADLTELRAVSFASERWREYSWKANFGNYFRNLSMQFSMVMDASQEDIPEAEQWKTDIADGAAWMDNKIAELAPNFGDMLAWSRAIPGGMEGWTYDWSENVLLENGSPLQVLQHAGRSPLLLLGIKQAEIPALNEMCDYFMEEAPEHAKRFIYAAEKDEADRELALKVFDRAWPLFEQAAEIFRDQIAPALDDRETLLVAAAGWTTRQLNPALPMADEPLSIPEFAIACRLNDREQFIGGCVALYEVFDRSVELVRDLYPDAIPAGYSVPRPQEENFDGATSYFYEELVDAVELEGFKPQVIVSDEALVIGYSDRQVRDMIEAKPLATRPAWLTDETPVAAVSYVDYAGMFAAARSWIQFGFSMSGLPLDEPLTQAPLPVPSASDILQIWDCFSSAGIAAGTATIHDDGPSIARWVWVGR